MMARRNHVLALLVAVSALVMAACGGGGEGTESEPIVEPDGPASSVGPPLTNGASLDEEGLPNSAPLSQIFPSAIDDAVPQPRGVPIRTAISAESTTMDQELFGFVGVDGVVVLTLAAQDGKLLDPTHRVKITRGDVYRTVAMAAVIAPSNTLIKGYFKLLADT